jgi:hypothetical protein
MRRHATHVETVTGGAVRTGRSPCARGVRLAHPCTRQAPAGVVPGEVDRAPILRHHLERMAARTGVRDPVGARRLDLQLARAVVVRAAQAGTGSVVRFIHVLKVPFLSAPQNRGCDHPRSGRPRLSWDQPAGGVRRASGYQRASTRRPRDGSTRHLTSNARASTRRSARACADLRAIHHVAVVGATSAMPTAAATVVVRIAAIDQRSATAANAMVAAAMTVTATISPPDAGPHWHPRNRWRPVPATSDGVTQL